MLALAPGLDQHLLSIKLEVDREQPDFGREWNEDPKARGEALLLLEEGHLLGVNQRKPSVLIEFGMSSAQGHGVSRDTVLAADRPFALPEAPPRHPEDEVSYRVLAWWTLGDDAEREFASLNDIAADDDGRLPSSAQGRPADGVSRRPSTCASTAHASTSAPIFCRRYPAGPSIGPRPSRSTPLPLPSSTLTAGCPGTTSAGSTACRREVGRPRGAHSTVIDHVTPSRRRCPATRVGTLKAEDTAGDLEVRRATPASPVARLDTSA